MVLLAVVVVARSRNRRSYAVAKKWITTANWWTF